MKRFFQNIRFVMGLALIMTLFVLSAPAHATEWEKIIIPFDLGSTSLLGSYTTGMIRIPQSAKIDSVYITGLGGLTASTTDGADLMFLLNNVDNGSWTSSATLVATVPEVLTPVDTTLEEGDTLFFKLTKVGVGATTSGLGVAVTIHNTTSR